MAITSDGICKIIEAAARADVCHFKMGTLEISFVPKIPEIIVQAGPQQDIPPMKEHEESEQEQLDRLLIENPAEWARRIEQGDEAQK